jgi:Fur family ferric uptake transcriptional regulator
MRVPTKTMRISGRRNTSQRKLLLDLIQQADGHMDAYELYELARQHEPAISLSTVYRNLKLFKELGLVEERHFAEEHHHYEAKPSVEHHHLVCLGCGQVQEFVSPLAKRMVKEVGRDNGFEISKTEIRMEGYCPRCQGEVRPK